MRTHDEIIDELELHPDRCMFWLCTRDKHTGNETVRACYRTARPDSAFCWQHQEVHA